MAKILYGVAGEGSGHSARAIEVIHHLQKRGHIVKVVSHDRGYKNLSPIFDTTEILGLNFVYVNNEVRYISTAIKNVMKLPQAEKSIMKILHLVDDFHPDLIFSDFEPFSAFVANVRRIPLISIDNQHHLTGAKLEYPKKYRKSALAAKAVTKFMVVNAKAYLVTTFFPTPITNKKTFLFPPLVRSDVLSAKPLKKDYVFVYLTSEYAGLLDMLKTINKKFIVYGFDRDEVEENITLKKHSFEGFFQDLVDAQAIIANTGFTLISEALYLGKPYLAIPVAGQFEQVLNACYLEKMGYGKLLEDLNKEAIENFLNNLSEYQKNLDAYEREDNHKLFDKIDELIEKYTKKSKNKIV